jgi:NitT/TauT family transport system substrate-binding protein
MIRRAGVVVLIAVSVFGLAWSSAGAQEAIKVRLVQSAPALAFAPIYVANGRKLWAEAGLDADSKIVTGGPLAITALVNNEADFAFVVSGDPVISWAKGLPVLVVGALATSSTMSVAARKDWMQARGVTPQSPVKERVRALKGSRIGVATLAGGPAQYTRYILKSHDLDPEKDATLLPVGQAASRVAALRENRIDLFLGASPDIEISEAEGFGATYLVLAKEVPAFQNFLDLVVVTTKEYAEKNGEAVRRVVRTIARANGLLQTDLAGTTAVLKQAFPKISPQVMDRAVANSTAAFNNSAAMSEPLWKNTIEVLLTTGMINRAPPTADGTLWTNKFLK